MPRNKKGTPMSRKATEKEIEPEQDEQKIRDQVLARFVKRHHPENQIIGNKQVGMQMRIKSRQGTCLVCQYEPKNVKVALENEEWINAMNEEIQ